MSSVSASAPPPIDETSTALFLDLDGTLAGFAPRPDEVEPSARLTAVLQRLLSRLDGRVAVLTGRGLEDADRILEATVPSVAAVHGLVRRLPDGSIASYLPSSGLDRARLTLDALVRARQGLILEDKGASLALHYRLAPQAEDAVREATRRIAQSTGLIVQDGAMVSELRTDGPNKGDALRAFMTEPPLAGAKPIMVGDDLTDEHAFAAAEELGGYGILVGADRPSQARFRLDDVEAVLAWLEGA